MKGGRGFARWQPLDFDDAGSGKKRLHFPSEIKECIRQKFAVAHPQKERAASFARELPEPVERDVGGCDGSCGHGV